MMQEEVQHEYYLDYDSYPIRLNPHQQYKVLETRVQDHDTFDNIVLHQHLVEEVVNS